MSIGVKIKERRLELGMTQEELALKMGYKSKSTINKIELGINDIPLSKVEEFAKALATTEAYLMGWNDSVTDSSDRESVTYTDQADSLFIDKYGMQTYDVAMKYDRLDDKDKIRAEERIDTLLEDDKYKRDSFEAMAI